MYKNYLEKLRFSITLENLNDKKTNPEISLGINGEKNHFFNLQTGINKFVFDEIIYETGENYLSLYVESIDDNTHSFIIKDLSIHGISITRQLYQCVYFPTYNKDYLLENPNAPTEIKSGLYIGNAGKWYWYFNSPIKENANLKIGLW